MKKVIVEKFVANDGKEFTDEMECLNYENNNKPLEIKTNSELLSKLIFDDYECKNWDSSQWNNYARNLKERLQKVYNILENGDKEEMVNFFSNFDYYDIGDIIHFIELLKFNVN